MQILSQAGISHVMLYVGHGFVIEAVGDGVKLSFPSQKRCLDEDRMHVSI